MRAAWRRFVRRRAFGDERLAKFIVASWAFHLSLWVLVALVAIEAYGRYWRK